MRRFAYELVHRHLPAGRLRQGFRHTLNFHRFAGGFINVNQNAVEHYTVFGHFESLGHGREKFPDDWLDFTAQHTFVRPGEARVAQIRRAAGENLFVRRLHVGVRAHHGAHLSIEIAAQGDLLRGRFGVKIHKNDPGLLPQPCHLADGKGKGIIQLRLHKSATLHVQDRDGNRTWEAGPGTLDLEHAAALSRNLRRIIERPEKALFVGEQLRDFLLVPKMVAAGDDIHAGGKNFFGGPGGNPGSAGGIFAVGDDEIERVLFTESGQEFPDGSPAGLAHDVADEEQFHKPNLIVNRTEHTKEKKRWKTNQTKALKYPVGRRKGDVLMRRAFKLAKPLHDVRRLVGVGIGVGQVELVIFYGVVGFVFAPGNFAETVIDPV